jgi:glycerate 2-kinase
VIPQTVLVAVVPFDPPLSSPSVALAIARGLLGAGVADVEECLLAPGPAGLGASLDHERFDERMRACKALVIAAPCLHRHELKDSIAFELATRARQAGVPAYAIAQESTLDLFDARMLDLQMILEARTPRALQAAAAKLAALL